MVLLLIPPKSSAAQNMAGSGPYCAFSGMACPALGAVQGSGGKRADAWGYGMADKARGKGSGDQQPGSKLDGSGEATPGPERVRPGNGSGSERINPRSAKPRDGAEPVVMQRDNERGRVVVVGRRTDDNTRCALVVIHELGGTWSLYPHGVKQFGVRITKADAITMAQAILGSVQ